MLINNKLKKTAIACAILAGLSPANYVLAETTDSAISTPQQKTFHVNDESSFRSALQTAQAGDIISLSANVDIQNYTQQSGKSPDPLYLDKKVTIEGNGHALSVRAAPLALKEDVILKNLKLQLKPLNEKLVIDTEAQELTSYIYANGHRLELDNVTTNAEGLHDRTRPTIIMGTVDDSVADAGHAELVVKNSQAETHFKQIIANSLNADKSTPTKISLDKDTKLIDNTGLQIDFSAAGHAMTGKVEVILDGTKVSSLGGDKAAENSVTLKNASLVNPRLVGLKDLTLEKSSVAAGGVNVKGKLDLKDNSTLSIDSYSSDMTTDNTPEADRKKVQAQTVNSEGGTIELRVEDSSVKVAGDMTGDLTLKIAPAANLSGDIVTVEGNNSATITSGNEVYKVEKNGDNKWTVSKNPPAGSNEDEEDIDDEDEDWTVTPDPNATPSEEKPTEQPTNPEETPESNTSDQGTATEPNSNSGEEATKPSTPEEKPSENTAGEQTGSEQPQTDNPNESGNNAEESSNNPTTPEQPPAEKPTDDNASSGDQNGEQANGSNETNGETSTPGNGSETTQPNTNGEENKPDAGNDAGNTVTPPATGEEETKPTDPTETTPPNETSDGSSENTAQPPVTDPTDEKPTDEQGGNSANTETPPANEGNNVTPPTSEDNSKPTEDNSSSSGETAQPGDNSAGSNENTEQPPVTPPTDEKPAGEQGGNSANTETPPANEGNNVTPPTSEDNNKPTAPTEDNSGSSGETAGNETTQPGDNSASTGENTEQPPVTTPTDEKPAGEQGSGSANTETPSTNEGNDATPPATNEENSKPTEPTTEDNSSSSGETAGNETAQPGDNSASSNENTPQPPVTDPTDEKPAGEQDSGSANTENPSTNEGNDATPPTTNEENGKPTAPTEDHSASSGETAGNESTQPSDNSASSNENTAQPPVTDPTDEKPAGEQGSGSANTENPSTNEGNDATPPATNEDNNKPTEDNSSSSGETAGNESTQPGDNSASTGENTEQPPVTAPTENTDNASEESAGTHQPTPDNSANNEVLLLNQHSQKAVLLLDMSHSATFTSARQNANALIERSYDRNEGEENLWVKNSIAKEKNGFSDEKYKDISRHLMIGVDKCSAYLCAGVAFSANNSDLSSDNLSLQQKMYYAFGYGNYALSDNTKVDFYLGGGVGKVKDRNAHRAYRAKSLQSGVGIGYSFVAESYRVTPFVRADYVATHYAAYQTEAFSVASHTAKSLVAKAGVRVDKQVNQNLSLFAKAETGVETLKNGSASVSVGNQNQTLNLPTHSRHSASMGAGVSYSFTPNMKISAAYNYERRRGYNNQSADLALQYKF